MTGNTGTYCHHIVSLPHRKLFQKFLNPYLCLLMLMSGETPSYPIGNLSTSQVHHNQSPVSVDKWWCANQRQESNTITDSLRSCKCSFLDLRFKTNALPGTASTIAQLKAAAKEIVENPDGAAGPEGAPRPPRKSKGLAQSQTQRSVVAMVIPLVR